MNIDHAYEETCGAGVQLTEEEQRRFADMRTRLAQHFQGIVDIEAGVRGLSKREEKILNLMLDGRTNPDMCQALGITETVLRKEYSRVLTKFGVTSRAALCAVVYGRS